MIPILPQQDIIKHFRHINKEAHGEPETQEHLEMKAFIYNLLTHTQLEKKIGNRIADIVKGTCLVIECQCSPISRIEMKQREDDYLDHEHYVLWVFGGEYYQNTNKKELCIRRNSKYYIQRIKGPERYLLDNDRQPLIYYHNKHFYIGTFVFRKKGWYEKCKTLGWYKLKRYNPEYFRQWLDKGNIQFFSNLDHVFYWK